MTTKTAPTAAELASVGHPWERAGHGMAPFALASYHTSTYQACQGAPIQPGTTCDACGTGIMHVFVIRSADGKRFQVGSDCVEKLGRADNRLLAAVDRIVKANEKKLRAARKAVKVASVHDTLLTLDDPAVRARLAAQPHPMFAGKTLLDWCLWMANNSGHAGKCKVAKVITSVAGSA